MNHIKSGSPLWKLTLKPSELRAFCVAGRFPFDPIMLEGAILKLLQDCSQCINVNMAGPCA